MICLLMLAQIVPSSWSSVPVFAYSPEPEEMANTKNDIDLPIDPFHVLSYVSAKPATCTDSGNKAYYACSDCGKLFEDSLGTVEITDKSSVVIPAAEHTPAEAVRENEVAATCCAAGSYDEVIYCSVCHEEVSRELKTIPIDEDAHDWGEGVQNGTPTCTEGASVTYTCNRCEEQTVEVYPAAGHSYTAIITPPTCEEDGYTTYTCPCGDSYVADYVDATGHTFGEWYTVKDATCTENGAERRDCANCDAYETNTLPATGHSYNAVVTEPTCTEKGYTNYTCHCGDSYVSDYVYPTGHAWSDWQDAAPGKEERSCTACGETESRDKIPDYDIDGNGVVEESDVKDLLSILVGNSPSETLPDLDFDGVLTIYDCVLLMQQIQ